MENYPHSFSIGDRVRALRRTGFPEGTILQLLDSGFVLVRWQGDLLETAHYSDVEHATPPA
jgi:hypothetical protein